MSNEGEGEEGLQHDLKWVIRPMKHEDIEKCLRIWSKVELTEAHQTVSSALSADPNGFYVAELEDSGEVIGMCAGPMTRDDTAFMGFYAVEPAFQRIGIGRELWAKTLGRLGSSINVGLYGVPSMSEKYKRSGFTIEDTTRMLIFESERKGSGLNIEALKDIDELATGCSLKLIDGQTDEAMFKKLVDYDSSIQRFSRENLLKLYLNGEDAPLTLALIEERNKEPSLETQHRKPSVGERKLSCCAKQIQEAIKEDETLCSTTRSSLSISTPSSIGGDEIKSSSPVDIPSLGASTKEESSSSDILGYGCIRLDNNNGGMIGPIYADSSEFCEVILKNLMQRFELKSGNIFSVMALSSNKQACKILKKAGLSEMEQCSRMFTKFVPTASFSKIYYVHSPNFTLF